MNEAQTRTHLIDDELNKCDWNTKDITKVVEEYAIELDDNLPPFFDRTKRFVDYCQTNSKIRQLNLKKIAHFLKKCARSVLYFVGFTK